LNNLWETAEKADENAIISLDGYNSNIELTIWILRTQEAWSLRPLAKKAVTQETWEHVFIDMICKLRESETKGTKGLDLNNIKTKIDFLFEYVIH
jgi:hypothetical protein